MTDENQVYDPRRAGVIGRYHSQLHLTHQSVAEHTWQVLRILTTLWPDAPREVLIYVIYHDIAEGVTGDAPYPVKLGNRDIKRLLDEEEDKAIVKMREVWEIPGIPKLTEEQLRIVKGCELIEMWEWSLYEENMGNRYASIVAERLLVRFPDYYCIPGFGKRFSDYVQRRGKYELGYQRNAKPA